MGAEKIPAYSGEVLYCSRDEHGAIAVVEEASSRTLHFGSTARQSTMFLRDPVALALSYTRCMFAGLLFAPPPARLLLLGLGGGSLAKFALHHFEGCRVEAVEMRPQVAQVARTYFHLPDDPRLSLHLQRAEEFLQRQEVGPYDWVMVDLHNRDGMAPVMDQPDFFVRCQALLTRGGVLSVNLWTGARDESLRRIGARLRDAFAEQVLFLPVARKRNTVGLAFRFALPSLEVRPTRAAAAALERCYGLEFVDFLWDILRYNRQRRREKQRR